VPKWGNPVPLDTRIGREDVALKALYSTLTEAMLDAEPHRLFITMWHDEDEIETVTFGEFTR
jgi:hypothetical protein